MLNTKAIRLFQAFAPDERRLLKKFVHSPAHNSNRSISIFYDFLDSKKKLSEAVLKREKVFEAVFPNQPFDDLILRRLLSDFFRILEDFIIWQKRENRGAQRALLLSKFCRERHLNELAAGYLATAESENQQAEQRSGWFQLEKYQILEERFRQHGARTEALNIQEMSDALADFFSVEMLRIACTATSHRAVFKTDYSLPFLEKVLADCEAKFENQNSKTETQNPKLIPQNSKLHLYFVSFGCLSDATRVDKFSELKSLLGTAPDWLDAQELGEVFIYAINFCIRRLNMGDTAFFREVFDLYKIGLAREVFLEAGQLSRFTFKNIVSAALKLGELAWVRDFIEKYAPLLAAEFRESYRSFCLARYFYDLRAFDEAQSQLQNLQSDDVFLELDARILGMKIWFQTHEWRLLQAFFKTFSQFISRKKMLAYHAENYRNILFFAQKVAVWQSGQRVLNELDLENLRLEIEKTQPLTEKEWLLSFLKK